MPKRLAHRAVEPSKRALMFGGNGIVCVCSRLCRCGSEDQRAKGRREWGACRLGPNVAFPWQRLNPRFSMRAMECPGRRGTNSSLFEIAQQLPSKSGAPGKRRGLNLVKVISEKHFDLAHSLK
jgi:hypothetical protein